MGAMSDSQTIRNCRSCGGAELIAVLDLGTTTLANRLLTAEQRGEPEPRFSLRLVFCPACTLVQITETVAPEILFRDYAYFSSFSDGMREHARKHTEELCANRRLGEGSLVIEVASNDGYLLQHFVARNVPVLGIEPARNIAKVANGKGVRTRAEFFTHDYARALRAEGFAADVLLGNNVLAHVADLNGFIAGAAELMKDDGAVVFEFPYVGEMIDRIEFDTIYHEHLCYFSAHAIEALFRRHGLAFTDVRRLDIHGGSLRVTGSRRENPEGRARVLALLDEERQRGMDGLAYYADFAQRVEKLKSELLETLGQLKSSGKRLAAYGASAKGATLMAYFGIGRETLEYVVDRSTVKQGRYTPGTHLQILPTEKLLEDRPDAVLLLTWNFADEILRQQEAYRKQGGRFIIPLPEVRIT
jgi:hypothetical protein